MELGLADRWMLSKLQRAKTALQRAFETYRFDHAAKEIYELIWNHYCDWYLELCKPALQDGTPARKRGARRTLAGVLEEMLRLAHPFMPFLTEEIWQALAPAADKSGATIMTQPYPELQQEKIDAAAETEMERVIEITQAIRKLRSEHRIAPGKRVSVSLKAAGADAPPQGESPDYIATLARALLCDTAEAGAATVVAGGAHIALSLSGAVDAAEELARAERELAELSRHLERSTAKLANAEFVKKAPAAVVEKERARLAELETKRDGMTGKLEGLRARA